MRCLYVRIDIQFCPLIRVSCNGTNISVHIASTVTLPFMAVTSLDVHKPERNLQWVDRLFNIRNPKRNDLCQSIYQVVTLT